MANALVVKNNVINLTFDGSGNDIDFNTYFPNGLRLAGINFMGVATDVFVLKFVGPTGEEFIHLVGPSFVSWHAAMVAKDLFLDISACTLGTPASCIAILYLA